MQKKFDRVINLRSHNMPALKIAIIGLGSVGLPLCLLACEKNMQVLGISNNKNELATLMNKYNTIANLILTHDFTRIKDVDCIIICVPTPATKIGIPDYRILKSVFKRIAKTIRKDQLIILESTVQPGSCTQILIPLLEQSNLICGQDFNFAYCPERINIGDPKWNISNIDRVISGYTDKCLNKAISFYQKLLTASLFPTTSLETAEMIKIFENAFRLVNISFVNEVATLCQDSHIDINEVVKGAATKPFGFLPFFPGCGVGGHCIPKDSYFLANFAKINNKKTPILTSSIKTNRLMPQYFVDLTLKTLKQADIDPKKAKILILGLSYKPNVADYRNSIAWKIINILKKLDIDYKIYDSYFPKDSFFKTLDSALKYSDTVIITTAHDYIKKLSLSDFSSKQVKVVIDGRNCIKQVKESSKAIIYHGIGL